MKFRLVFLGLIGLSFILFIGVFLSSNKEFYEVDYGAGRPATESNRTYVEIIKQWKACKYKQIDSETELKNLIRNIKINNYATSANLGALNQALYNFIIAFHNPTYENFKRFRIPTEKFDIYQDQLNWHRNWLKENNKGRQLSNLSQLELVEERFLANLNMTQGTVLFWTDICWSKSFVETESIQNSPVSLREFIKNNSNTGIIVFKPTFRFIESPDEVLSKQGNLEIATAYLLVKTVYDDPPYPIVCRFYWEPNEKLWLPLQLGISYVGPRKGQILF